MGVFCVNFCKQAQEEIYCSGNGSGEFVCFSLSNGRSALFSCEVAGMELFGSNVVFTIHYGWKGSDGMNDVFGVVKFPS